MNHPEDIAAHLPAPRDDEPSSLRRDIVDELSDHLQTALRREQHFTSDETAARHRVLTKFGNPATIARRLWWDAMKEKIMSQRISMIMSTVMAVVCLAALGLVWNVVLQNRDVKLAMLEALRELRAEAVASKSLDWNPLKARLVLDAPDGPPAAGYTVQLFQGAESAYDNLNMKDISDPDGLVDFGLVRPGQCQLTVTTPWNESLVQHIAIRPGESNSTEIVCPSTALGKGDVEIQIAWPEDLQDQNLWVICSFERVKREFDDIAWYYRNDKFSQYQTTLVMNSNSLVESLGELRWHSPTERHPWSGLVGRARAKYNQFQMTDPSPPQLRTVRRIAVDHILLGIEIIAPPYQHEILLPLEKPEHRDTVGGGWDSLAVPLPSVGRHSFDDSDLPTFSVKPNELNRWTISLPDQLVKQIRQNLAARAKKS